MGFQKSFSPTLLTKPLKILLDHKKHKEETCLEQITMREDGLQRVKRVTLANQEGFMRTMAPDTGETSSV